MVNPRTAYIWAAIGALIATASFLAGAFWADQWLLHTGFLGDPKVELDRFRGPFNRSLSAEVDEVMVYYLVDTEYNCLKGVRLRSPYHDGSSHKSWERSYECLRPAVRALDADGDGLKEFFIPCLTPQMVYLDDSYAFISRPQDQMAEWTNLTLLTDPNGGVLFRERPPHQAEEGPSPRFFRWSRDRGFFQVESPKEALKPQP